MWRLLLLLVLALGAGTTYPCNTEAACKNCVGQIPKDFFFLKSYSIDGNSHEVVEYSYVLTQGTQYLINVCDEEMGEVAVNVFNSDRKKIASSEVAGKRLPAIIFSCSVTGIYYLKYGFTGNQRCGGSSLSFKR